MAIESVEPRAVKNAIKELLGKAEQLRRLL
jgi:hypothetical protein